MLIEATDVIMPGVAKLRMSSLLGAVGLPAAELATYRRWVVGSWATISAELVPGIPFW